jgi:hypothetical protein
MTAERVDEVRIAVYVPRPGTPVAESIAARSGIVGTPLFNASDVLIDYEGDIYRVSPRTFADRCFQAAGRHVSKYPTVARMVAQVADLVEVGEFDGDCVLVYVDRLGALAEWLGQAPADLFDPHELHRSEERP